MMNWLFQNYVSRLHGNCNFIVNCCSSLGCCRNSVFLRKEQRKKNSSNQRRLLSLSQLVHDRLQSSSNRSGLPEFKSELKLDYYICKIQLFRSITLIIMWSISPFRRVVEHCTWQLHRDLTVSAGNDDGLSGASTIRAHCRPWLSLHPVYCHPGESRL